MSIVIDSEPLWPFSPHTPPLGSWTLAGCLSQAPLRAVSLLLQPAGATSSKQQEEGKEKASQLIS